MSTVLRIFVPHASELFTNHLPNGDGLVAFEVASRLAKRGHEVFVMAPNIDVRGELPATLHLQSIAGSGGPDLRGRIAYLPRVRATYARLARARPIDVIHQLNPVFAGVSLALLDARAPVVLGSYVGVWPPEADPTKLMGAVTMPFGSVIKREVVRLQQRRASAIIVTTPAAAVNVVEPDRSRPKTFLIPHGIDPNVYDGEADVTGEAGDEPIVLFLGGMERRKGIYVLLDAFALVSRAMPGARLLIAGAGGRERAVAERVREMPARDRIEMLGTVAREDVPALIHRATVFAAPSFGEPFGMALLEAMASARPVVVTDAGGPAYLVDADGGCKVPVGDASALAEALLSILRSPERARAMGRYNRAKVEAEFTWDDVIARTESVYEHVLARRRAA